MKLKFILVFVVALCWSINALADDTDAELSNTLSVEDTRTSMAWPMLPGESLQDLAKLFYPNSKAMQQKFIYKTLRYTKNQALNLSPDVAFDTPLLVEIPTLKSLANSTRAIGSANSSRGQKTLNMSYHIDTLVNAIPKKLEQEYESLFAKNEFLKNELVRLHEKIGVLQTTLNRLKELLNSRLEEPAKKVFKNLSKKVEVAGVKINHAPDQGSWWNSQDFSLLTFVLPFALALLLGAYLLKRYREKMLSQLSWAYTTVQETVVDFSQRLQAMNIQAPPTESELEAQASKALDARFEATLEEAKMLMSVNRTTDAIALLKESITSYPKGSINHWLYLLEIFRKLNMKEEFEQHAADMHQKFNVMTPVWYETEVALVVAQSLEEFPHIIERLQSVWPGELAKDYLRNLINDNRGGERTGFGKAVIAEILMLIELLDNLDNVKDS